YIDHLHKLENEWKGTELSYHYFLPFEEHSRTADKWVKTEEFHRDHPLFQASILWALENGELNTKLNALQALDLLKDVQFEPALRNILMNPNDDDYIKKIVLFILRGLNAKGPFP